MTALEGYRSPTYDDAVAPDGSVRPAARAVMDAVIAHDVGALAAGVGAEVDARGIRLESVDGDGAWHVDPVSRVIAGAEWERLAAGLGQRVRALDAFVADVYAERRIVADGVVGQRVLDSADGLEPAMAGLRPAGDAWIGIAGLDVVRDGAGAWLVLEDNVRTPSGLGYWAAAREATLRRLELPPGLAPRPIDGLGDALRRVFGDGRVAVLTDGPDNSAYWEHEWIDTVVGELLHPVLAAGNLRLINCSGTGIADDKPAHAYVPDMIRFYLSEDPLIDQVETFDLGEPATLERALDVFDELVIKDRGSYGGVGVVICPHAERADIEELREQVRAAPDGYVAQRLVELSTHPTEVDGDLAPRHVDLRPFVLMSANREVEVLPGGITRVALDAGALVVNSSQNGGAKDTWVLP